MDEIETVIHHLLGICSRFDLAARFALHEEQNGDKGFSSRRGSAEVVYPNAIFLFVFSYMKIIVFS
ncbi:MAG: hypothetical protein WBB23_22440 [Desulforhopalus sp.]